MWPIALKFGALAALPMALVMLLPFAVFDIETLVGHIGLSEGLGYGVMVLSLSLCFFAMRARRERSLGGSMTFGQAFFTGLAFALVTAALFGVGTTLLYALMGEAKTLEFMEAYIRHNAGPTATAEELQAAMEAFEVQKEWWLSPVFQGLTMFGTVFPLGALVSLFWSFFAKKK